MHSSLIVICSTHFSLILLPQHFFRHPFLALLSSTAVLNCIHFSNFCVFLVFLLFCKIHWRLAQVMVNLVTVIYVITSFCLQIALLGAVVVVFYSIQLYDGWLLALPKMSLDHIVWLFLHIPYELKIDGNCSQGERVEHYLDKNKRKTNQLELKKLKNNIWIVSRETYTLYNLNRPGISIMWIKVFLTNTTLTY